MKTLIRIDRSTIQKNPNAGNTVTYIDRRREVTGVLYGEIPAEYEGRLIITTSEYVMDGEVKQEFIVTGDPSDILEKLAKDQRISDLHVDNEQQVIHHAPEPNYLYEYEDTPVQCQQCKAMILVEDIQRDYESDVIADLCPNCEGLDTFDYEYEKFRTRFFNHS